MTMQLTYELEKADLLTFQRHVFKTAPALKKMRRVFLWFLLAFVSFLSYDPESLFASAAAFVFYLAIGLCVFWVLTWASNEYLFRKSVPQGKDNGLTGRHQLIIDEHKVVEITSVNEAHHQWKGMDRVEENEQHIYIFIMPQAAHIIPKRAFVDEQQAAQFLATAKELLARAKNGAAATARFDRQPITKAASAAVAAADADKMPVAYFDERARSPIERVFSE